MSCSELRSVITARVVGRGELTEKAWARIERLIEGNRQLVDTG